MGDCLRVLPRVAFGGLRPDVAEELDVSRPLIERRQVDPVARREPLVHAAPAVVHEQRLGHVEHEEVRGRHTRRIMGGVLARLPIRPAERHVGGAALHVLGLEDEVAGLVAVDEPGRLGAVARDQLDGELELVPGTGGEGGRHAERLAEVAQVALGVRPLGGGNPRPAVAQGAERDSRGHSGIRGRPFGHSTSRANTDDGADEPRAS